MTKAHIVTEIAQKTGMEKIEVLTLIEAFMQSVKESMERGEHVYLRGFGTFVVKKRAEKLARNITAKTTVLIPSHYTPTFKPSKPFARSVQKKVKKVKDWTGKMVD